ncbi:MAG: hypothetical protein PHH37_12855 [Paludibacter sp.]|nr:hypothetical protein [Paludibacter sp.]
MVNSVGLYKSGLPGISTGVDYYFHKELSNAYPVNYEFQTKLNYGLLMKPKDDNGFIKPYHHAEISAGAIWSYSVPVSKLNIDMGGGMLFHVLVGYNSGYKFDDNYYTHLQPYGNWLAMPSTALKLQYEFENIKLRTKLIIPVCVGGFFREYQYYPYLEKEFLSYIITPNTLAFCNKYTAVFAEADCIIPLNFPNKRKRDLKIGLYLDYTNSSIHYIIERKRNIGLTLGLQLN